ncbi:MAG: Na(+)/H(+) antiporter subunit D [Puniceicoccaceae bacterium]
MSSPFLHPSLILLLGAVALPCLPPRLRRAALLLVPAVVLAVVAALPSGVHGELRIYEWTLVFGRVDALSRVFALIMALMALLGSLYAWKVEDVGQHVASWLYVGGSLGAILAGDLLVLFFFWEWMALSSVFLIWARRSPESLAAGYRYLLVHGAGGLLLLAGILLHGSSNGGDFAFEAFTQAGAGVGVWLILAGVLVNAAAPPLHGWLPDAYPAATFSGAVFLSAFTTKTAVYALCRGFPGFEILVPLGVVMALYGVTFAFLVNDCRRLLSYHIVSQVGFMVAGVGVGTALAVNGAIAHAFAHILYKGLLFMGCGAVLMTTGRSKFTELGGLAAKMPWTLLFTAVGAMSISALPLFSGFVSKSMTVAGVFADHRYAAAYLLMLASVGTFVSIGCKLLALIWFGESRGGAEVERRAADPPWNMMAAMAAAAGLCVLIGIFPGALYGLLPHAVDYHPYTAYHVMETLQLLGFAALGFHLLRAKFAPKAVVVRDPGQFYRPPARAFAHLAGGPLQGFDRWWSRLHERGGIRLVMRSAAGVGVFDNRVVDAAVDGTARAFRRLGGVVRTGQRGRLQQGLSLGLGVFMILLLVLWSLAGT